MPETWLPVGAHKLNTEALITNPDNCRARLITWKGKPGGGEQDSREWRGAPWSALEKEVAAITCWPLSWPTKLCLKTVTDASEEARKTRGQKEIWWTGVTCLKIKPGKLYSTSGHLLTNQKCSYRTHGVYNKTHTCLWLMWPLIYALSIDWVRLKIFKFRNRSSEDEPGSTINCVLTQEGEQLLEHWGMQCWRARWGRGRKEVHNSVGEGCLTGKIAMSTPQTRR